MAFSEFYLSVLGPLRVLRERCFKALKVPLSESFFTIEMLIFVNFVKTKLFAITVSKGGRGTFSVFYMGKYFILWNICKNMKFEYFEFLESFQLNIELEAICPWRTVSKYSISPMNHPFSSYKANVRKFFRS